MRKTLLLAISATLFAFNAMAQWSTDSHKGDELLGTAPYKSYTYTASNGDSFIYWSNDYNFRLYAAKGIFFYKGDFVNAVVGYYSGDELINRESVELYVPEGKPNTAQADNNWELADRIITHIENGGRVRIVADKYSGADFDITIPARKKAVKSSEKDPLKREIGVEIGMERTTAMQKLTGKFGAPDAATAEAARFTRVTFQSIVWREAIFLFKEGKLSSILLKISKPDDFDVHKNIAAIKMYSEIMAEEYTILDLLALGASEKIETDGATHLLLYSGMSKDVPIVDGKTQEKYKLYLSIELTEDGISHVLMIK